MCVSKKHFLTVPLLIFSAITLSGCVDNQGQMYNPWGTNELGIPYDMMPPPGLCRVWYPYRPAENQPPPGDCDYLAARMTSDAKLIRGGVSSTSPGSISSAPIPNSSYPPMTQPNPNPNSGYSSPGRANGQAGGYEYPDDLRRRQQEDLNPRY